MLNDSPLGGPVGRNAQAIPGRMNVDQRPAQKKSSLVPVSIFAGIIASTCALPGVIFGIQTDEIHQGIARGGLTLMTYSCIVIFGLCWTVGRLREPVPYRLPLMLLTLWLTGGLLLIWPESLDRWNGAIHLVFAAGAWVVGFAVGTSIDIDGKDGLLIAGVLVAFIAVQTVVGVSQVGSVASILDGSEGRVMGTLPHPGSLAKVLGINLIIFLPLTRSSRKTTRSIAIFGVIGTLTLLGATASRANVIAGASALVIWALFNPYKGRLAGVSRIVGPVLWLICILPFVSTIVNRFDADPDGGSRSELLPAAWYQISQTPWTGIGPNSYVEVVGSYDPITATGLPVHNALLLVTVETGVIGAVLITIPIVGAYVTLWKLRRNSNQARNFAWAAVATAPGTILVALTGWGIVAASILPLWLFMLAFSLGQAGQKGLGTQFQKVETREIGEHKATGLISRPPLRPTSLGGV